MAIRGQAQVGRPTHLYIDTEALKHNLATIKNCAPNQSILAMVKANAYGCSLSGVLPILEPLVAGFGVACLEEALAVRQYSKDKECWLMQGIFSADELPLVIEFDLVIVVHNPQQLAWLVAEPLASKIKVWVKVDTGMHRLGFHPREVAGVLSTLKLCPWIAEKIGLMTHFGCAETPHHPICQQQLQVWQTVADQYPELQKSVAHSAAMVALPEILEDWVRPGLMIYGASPFAERTSDELGLRPVMHFISAVSSVHSFEVGDCIGYGATWQCTRPSLIGVVPVGYGDGYPRHVKEHTQVWINGYTAPIVGRISMDMLTVDLTDCPKVKIGDSVELWGKYITIESVAMQANTIAYELMTQVTARPRIK